MSWQKTAANTSHMRACAVSKLLKTCLLSIAHAGLRQRMRGKRCCLCCVTHVSFILYHACCQTITRRYKTEEDREALLPVLRDMSRQEYLRKREDVKLVSVVFREFFRWPVSSVLNQTSI